MCSRAAGVRTFLRNKFRVPGVKHIRTRSVRGPTFSLSHFYFPRSTLPCSHAPRSLPHTVPEKPTILNASAIHRVLTRIAHEIVERNDNGHSVVLVGVQRGGIYLAERLG